MSWRGAAAAIIIFHPATMPLFIIFMMSFSSFIIIFHFIFRCCWRHDMMRAADMLMPMIFMMILFSPLMALFLFSFFFLLPCRARCHAFSLMPPCRRYFIFHALLLRHFRFFTLLLFAFCHAIKMIIMMMPPLLFRFLPPPYC